MLVSTGMRIKTYFMAKSEIHYVQEKNNSLISNGNFVRTFFLENTKYHTLFAITVNI